MQDAITGDIDRERVKEILTDPTVFVSELFDKEPYTYQENFLHADKKQRAFAAGRQVGKTTTLIWLALWNFIKPGNDILIFLPSHRQAKEFFDSKLKAEIPEWLENKDAYGISHETKTQLHGQNGSRIIALPAADKSGTGETIRMYTADCIIVDEAAFISDEFYKSVLAPMTLRTDGYFVLAGTPWGRQGYFYEKFNSHRWWSDSVSTMECPDVPAEKIEEFREDMTSVEFQREVLGEFAEMENAAFPEQILRPAIYKDGEEIDDIYPPIERHPLYLGVDPARYGDDRAVFTSMDDAGNVFDVEYKRRSSLQEVVGAVKRLNDERGYQKICIDSQGMGGGIIDQLENEVPNCEGIETTLKTKMDVYQTLIKAMEKGFVTIPDDPDFISEMRGVERQDTPSGNMKFHAHEGGHDDFPDSLAMAVFAKLGTKQVERATGAYTFTNHVDDDDDRDGPRAYSFGS